MMKVLLIKDVKSLGKAGEIKEVKDGYGHNFLIGKGFAKLATPEVLRQYEAKKRREAQEAAAELEKLKSYEEKLAKVKLLIKRPLGANGSLFGAVTKEEIANELNTQEGFDIDKKMVEIDKPIKATGVYDISIKLGHGIHATLNLEIAGE
jgi:large subunit ribosomal protein L9